MTTRALPPTRPLPTLGDERGIALVFVLLVSFAIAALALGAIAVGGNARIVSRFHATEAGLQGTADGGLEIARDALNRRDTALPDTGFITVTLNDSVLDAQNRRIPGFTRSIYAGRSGGRAGGVGSAGQYGNNLASAVSIIRNTRGAVAARRLLLTQESWSKFAVAINDWTNMGIRYGCGEAIQGPFHSNTNLSLSGGCNPRIPFNGPVTVAGSIGNQGSGNYLGGVTTGAARITWPTPADLGRLRQFAQESDAVDGDYDILGDPDTTSRNPDTRIEFLPVDVNGNGTIEWDEGFMRVYKARNLGDTARAYVTARRWPRRPDGVASTRSDTDWNQRSANCGAVVGGQFRTARQVWDSLAALGVGTGPRTDAVRALLRNPGRRCYLGGDPRLFAGLGDTLTPTEAFMNAFRPANLPDTTPTANYGFGGWRTRRLGPLPSLATVRPGDDEFLIPLGLNPNFRGIVFVRGSVAVSGRLRGRVSVAATGNVMLADDLTYVTAPGTECSEIGDIMGTFAVRDVLIQDNNIQSPMQLGGPTQFVGLFDDTPNSENYNMFILTLRDWAGDNYGWGAFPWSGPNEGTVAGESACGAPRGCVRVTGGITMGFVREATYVAGRAGWGEAHAYDRCGAISPPPYWPTTGRYSPNRYYELDPVWLNQMTVGELFRRLRSQ